MITNYELTGAAIGRLVAEKQIAYGNSFGEADKILKILWPNGVPVEQYRDFLAVTRIIDKLFRVANEKDAFGESPFIDIAGYGILAAAKADEASEADHMSRFQEPIETTPTENGEGFLFDRGGTVKQWLRDTELENGHGQKPINAESASVAEWISEDRPVCGSR